MGRTLVLLFSLFQAVACMRYEKKVDKFDDDKDGDPEISRCEPLPPPTGNIINVTPAQASQLASIVSGAAAGATILLADGTYSIGSQYISLSKNGLTLRSASGNRGAVIIDGGYAATEI